MKQILPRKLILTTLFFIYSVFCAPAIMAQDENLKKAVQLNDAATAKLNSGNLDGAEIDLLQALEYSGNNSSVRRNLGVVYYEKATRALSAKKDFFESQRYFRDALRIEPENSQYKKGYAAAIYLEANERVKRGQPETALNLYEKAAEMDPANIHTLVQASQYAWQTQQLDKARDYLKKAQAINAGDRNVQILQQRMQMPKTETQYDTIQSEHFILSAQPELMNQMGSHNILYELEQLYNQVSYKLSFYPKQKITVVLYTNADFHQQWSLPARVSGYYDGKLRIPYSPQHPSLDMIQSSVKHELTHAFIRAMNPKNVPTWIGEGLAQWVEGQQMDIKRKDALVIYQITYRLPDIEHLDQAFVAQKNPYNDAEMTSAYMKSFSLVEYLVESYGIWQVIQSVSQFDGKSTVDQIFRKNFGADSREIEARWIKWIERKGERKAVK